MHECKVGLTTKRLVPQVVEEGSLGRNVQGGKVQEGGSQPLEKLKTLTKQRTYQKQMAYQPVIDAIDQMDTGLELPPAAIKANAEHREYYNTFLRTQREARTWPKPKILRTFSCSRSHRSALCARADTP